MYKQNSTICLLATDKHFYLEEQIKELKLYFKNVFIMIDKKYNDLQLPYLQMENNPNYKNTHGGYTKQGYGAWSKALDYFNNLETENIWFIEYDVFYSSVDILLKLNKYKEHLLVKSHIPYSNDKDWTNWNLFLSQNINDFDKNWFHSLTCICRISKELLKLVTEFAKSHNTLFFHEILFNTIAEHNNLSIRCCDEFKYVEYKGNDKIKSFNINDIQKCGVNYVYHPIKDLDVQKDIKKNLKQIFI